MTPLRMAITLIGLSLAAFFPFSSQSKSSNDASSVLVKGQLRSGRAESRVVMRPPQPSHAKQPIALPAIASPTAIDATDNSFRIRRSGSFDFLSDDSGSFSDVHAFLVFQQHGILSHSSNPHLYGYEAVPSSYEGTDFFVYEICDNTNACDSATVTLFVVGDGENLGVTTCNTGLADPVNVTNGNMYLQQADYRLPGAGPMIDITRTYNSMSPSIGLFGTGWSTIYDETIVSYDADMARFNQADGRAVYFGRGAGSSGALLPIAGDFHGQLTQGSGSFTLTMKDGTVHEFDSAGKLVSLTDRNGNQTTLTYTNGHLESVTDPFARVLSFTTDSNGQVLTISDRIGTVATYTYDSGKLESVTYADDSSFEFAYDTGNRLTSVTDALGHVVESHTYDSQGRALTSEREDGVRHYDFDYVSATETDVTDALGNVSKYTFEQSQGRNLVTQVEGLCSCGGGGSQIQQWTYDDQLNVTSWTDALEHTTSFTYDGDGNQLTRNNATGIVTYTYNQFSEVLTRTDQSGGVTTNTYDTEGNLLTTEDALENTTTFTNDSQGQLLTTTDARGKVTSFTWDTIGRLTAVEDALNNVTTVGYDHRAHITSVTNALDETTSREYDAAGRLQKVIYPDSNFVLFTYDLAGRRTIVKDPRGNETSFDYDDANRLTSVTDALSHVTSFGYDLMSNRTSMTDALSRVTDYEYDDFNRLKKVTYPAATTGATRLFETVEYDDAGNVTERTDTAGRVTAYAYDEVNRVSHITDADDRTTRFGYDELSRIISVVDALDQEYDFAYDLLGRKTGMTRAAVSMSYAYDAVGNRTSRTDYKGVTTDYTYDDLNRLTTISYPNSTSVTYAYDVLSRLSTATNENGAVTFSYDSRGRVSETTDVWGKTVDYSYDENGNRAAMSLDASNYANYSYNAINQPTQLSDSSSVVADYSYDATNKLTSRSLPNGVASTYTYDNLNRLTHLNDSVGTSAILDNHYSYNTASQIVEKVDVASTTDSYEYDPLDRLTSSSSDGGFYSYDAVGNRLTSPPTKDYSYEPFNRLTSFDSLDFSYDDNGNQLTRDSQAVGCVYTYDFENRLTQVVCKGLLQIHPTPPPTVNYKYDALGRRVERLVDRSHATDDVQRYVYDGQDVIEDLDDNDQVVTSYFNGPGIDNKLRQTDSTNGNLYFTTDHLGSTTALTDDTGQLVESITYDSFGNSAGSSFTRYTYTGREFDTDTGLYYYRARWYDPQIGRFLSEDPIGFQGGDINLYGYVNNDPTKFRDPTGLRIEEGDNSYYFPWKDYYQSRHEEDLARDFERRKAILKACLCDLDNTAQKDMKFFEEHGSGPENQWLRDYNANRVGNAVSAGSAFATGGMSVGAQFLIGIVMNEGVPHEVRPFTDFATDANITNSQIASYLEEYYQLEKKCYILAGFQYDPLDAELQWK
jgi:RHS repeat-associated protein